MTLKRKTRALAPAQPYGKPPIIEAVIEFRFAEPLSARVVAKVSRKLKRGYVTRKEQKEITVRVDMQHAETQVQSEAAFFEHSSNDQTDVFIVKPAQLIWSRRAPYEGWNAFVSRVHQEMLVAMDAIGGRHVSRIGLRYINRIDVPANGPPTPESTYRYEDYISINLTLPSQLDPVDSYMWRIDRAFPEHGLRAALQSATLLPELPDMMSFLLDIDVSTVGDVPVKIEDLFAKLDKMRDLKNELFELSISDLARRGFQ